MCPGTVYSEREIQFRKTDLNTLQNASALRKMLTPSNVLRRVSTAAGSVMGLLLGA